MTVWLYCTWCRSLVCTSVCFLLLPPLLVLFWVRPRSKSNSFISNNRGHVQSSQKTSVSTCRELMGSTVLTVNQFHETTACFIFHWTDWEAAYRRKLKGKSKGKSLGKSQLSPNRRPPQKGEFKGKALAGWMGFPARLDKQPLWLSLALLTRPSCWEIYGNLSLFLAAVDSSWSIPPRGLRYQSYFLVG